MGYILKPEHHQPEPTPALPGRRPPRRGRLLDACDRPEEALAVFDDLLQTARAKGLGLAQLHALLGRGSALRDMGRVAEGRSALEEAQRLAIAGPLRNPLV